MRMLPDRLDPSTQSAAERSLFARLRMLDDDDWPLAVHSLNLARHDYKRVGEIDFLLLGRKGLFALEVKGGGVRVDSGTWYFTDRYGTERRKRQSPFTQVQTAMFALERRLEDVADPAVIRRTCFGSAVVFPDQVFDLTSVEWAGETVIDRPQLERNGGVLRSLNRMASWWRDRPGARTRQLTDADIDGLVDVLRPDYDVVPTLTRVAEAADAELAELTRQQYVVLDHTARNPRLIVEGGAGTGKSMLAVEMARRAAADGRSVLLTCESAELANFLADQPGTTGVTVSTVDALAQAGATTRFALALVDEAQDVINFDRLPLLDSLITGGIEDGRWVFLLDGNNQRGLVGSYDPEAMDILLSARPTQLMLTDNCRNTATIVEVVRSLTGADIGVSTAGRGPDVRVVDAAAEGLTVAAAVEREIRQLLDAGVDANQIMLLSTAPLAASSFGALPSVLRRLIDTVDSLSWQQRPRTRLGFATVRQFKGLESAFVVLTDVDPPGSGSAAPLYVGMTRARVGLHVVPGGQVR